MIKQNSGNHLQIPGLQKGGSNLKSLDKAGFFENDSDVEEQNMLMNQLNQHDANNKTPSQQPVRDQPSFNFSQSLEKKLEYPEDKFKAGGIFEEVNPQMLKNKVS